MNHPGHDAFIFFQIRPYNTYEMKQDIGINPVLKKTMQTASCFMQGLQKPDIFESQYEAGQARTKKQSIKNQVSAFDQHIVVSLLNVVLVYRMKVQGTADAHGKFLVFFLTGFNDHPA